MPNIDSPYHPSVMMKQGDVQTLYASLVRRAPQCKTIQETLYTADGDFLKVDWSRVQSKKVAILSHGLEGHTDRRYMRGMTHALNQAGWDTLAWNFRFCGGGPNKKLRMTHNGSTDDLQCVIDAALQANPEYEEIALVGFSMGGNITLLNLGKNKKSLSAKISKAVCLSVPCDLEACALELARSRNWIYMQKFLRTLNKKMEVLNELHPGHLDVTNLKSIKSFKHFDDRFTGPLHGFKDAQDYWTQCSSLPVLKDIEVPTLMLSAKDDPFLPDTCYPYEIAGKSPTLTLETPEHGGHVGFVQFNSAKQYYSEKRAVEFLNS